MNGAQYWARLIARLTRGTMPIDGITQPADEVREATEVESAKPRRRDPVTVESEFDLSIYPRWGNFR